RLVVLKMQNLNSIILNLFPLINADALVTDKNIEMELGEIPDLLLNEKEMHQMILNLVRNGLQAMVPGGTLVVKTFAGADGVIMAVKDQGKGIEPEVLEKIGTPFFTTKDTGTGLGLAVCYSIAARHNARIEIDTGSAGTIFSVRFNGHKKHDLTPESLSGKAGREVGKFSAAKEVPDQNPPDR
ncbi:MAG: HAMP domain-containing sensor histidine kinase, partial [Desulfotomaculaceae bacterium]|nr:HAMP domain-containing sensor histidine kinase [Desulfotomaculaceae bacterium]